jgi:predicted ATPase
LCGERHRTTRPDGQLRPAGGAPLFVEEVGRAVLEGGLLREEADRWTLDRPLPPRLAVPSSLHASLAARLDRLSSARDVAQAAAVIGREFAHDLLAAVSGLPEPALRGAMDALDAADLVQRRGAPPEAVYAFRHALIRDAAHGTLLRERRRDLHRRAADAIERLRPGIAGREPEMLAHHRAEAGEAEAAIALYLRAGERCTARAAFSEARAHLARGMALLPRLADDATARWSEASLLAALGSVAFSDVGA